MKIKNLIFTLALLISVTLIVYQFNKKEFDPEFDLSEIINDIKREGKFENASFEFMKYEKSKENLGKLVKVSFSNTNLEKLNVDEFGKKAALAVFNFNENTKKLASVWVCIEDKENVITKKTGIKLTN